MADVAEGSCPISEASLEQEPELNAEATFVPNRASRAIDVDDVKNLVHKRVNTERFWN